MASLVQLLARHGSILLCDAASTRVQAGLLRPGTDAFWRSGGADAGRELFPLVQSCLAAGGLRLSEVGAFIYCAGPGSMLGVRTVAMALRTWQTLAPRPAYAYLSLELLANDLHAAGAPRPLAVIADARRDSWHAVAIEANGRIGALERVPAAELTARPHALVQPTAFRSWSAPPRATRDAGYNVADLFTRQAECDLFRPAEQPDAFQHEAPDYKKWSAQVHSAASVPPR